MGGGHDLAEGILAEGPPTVKVRRPLYSDCDRI